MSGMVGWCNTNSALIRHASADVCVMAPQTPAFDYGTAIPRNRVYQVRSVPGVDWAEGLFMAWNVWQRTDGRRVNIELVGLDESCVAGHWKMKAGGVSAVHRPDTVLVDDLYLQALGIDQIGQEFEMIGERAVIGGITEEVRTFTASPFVFTSIDRPPILLADEPTAALDWTNGAIVIRLLTEQARFENSLLLTVTHDTRLLE
jgi:putative ABC transport system permease protein